MQNSNRPSIAKRFVILTVSFTLLAICVGLYRNAFFFLTTSEEVGAKNSEKKKKLYWFVPDGFRADRNSFNIYEWAYSGEMPNLKKLLDTGCRAYSWPSFPGHTPTNFATLMTGTEPEVHGVVDGPMRQFGYPLNISTRGGFSSFAKLVSPIWVDLEKSGYIVSLQSVPGSTPPELFNGNTITGRWGAWGVEFPSMIIQDNSDRSFIKELSINKRLFSIGKDLIKFVSPGDLSKWDKNISANASFEINLTNWSSPLFGAAVFGGVDGKSKKILISRDRKNIISELEVGRWSEWIPVNLKYELKNDYQLNSPKKTQIEREITAVSVSTFVKIKVIFLEKQKKFRVRLIYDALNEFITSPYQIAEELRSQVGHMVDYPDSYPPQLIYFKEDRQTFIEEADMTLEWHKNAVPFLVNNLKSDIIIHSIYTPNQMLTSRWWLPYLDPQSKKYYEISENERAQRWQEVKNMYIQIDNIIGKILSEVENKKDEDWYVVLSSDHGVIPLSREVKLNNYFAKKGWLKYKFNSEESSYEVDWENSKVVFLQMNNIYINPKSLGGVYYRDNSKEYYDLREKVITALNELEDPTNRVKPIFEIWKHEEASKAGLMADRVGDLIIANKGQYSWVEDITQDKEVFSNSKKGGYKQAVWPKSEEGMLTPFVITGKGIKKNCKLDRDIVHADQFATLKKIFSIKTNHEISGGIINEIFEEENSH